PAHGRGSWSRAPACAPAGPRHRPPADGRGGRRCFGFACPCFPSRTRCQSGGQRHNASNSLPVSMHSTPLRVLCIEDDPDDEVLVRLAARRLPMPVQWFTTDGAPGVDAAFEQGVDLVLSDYHLNGYSPLRAIEAIAARGLDIPLVVVSNAVGE